MIETFNTLQVRKYLEREYPYASRCFAEDFTDRDTLPRLTVSNWFQRYFPSPTGSNLFKQMEYLMKK